MDDRRPDLAPGKDLATILATVNAVEHLHWTADRPALRRPILVMAFEGWNDAGDAASTATRHVAETFDAAPFAEIDPELFYDFSTTRPFVRLDADAGRRIDWPSNAFMSATPAGDSEHDLIILTGVEPQLRWRTFADQIVSIATELDVELVVSLGALIADVAHSRPTTIYGTSDDRALCTKLDLEPSNYEGPTGIVGVIHNACRRAGLGSVSLWGSVPSYVPHASSPKAALALIDRLGTLLDLPILGGELVEATAEYERQINELVDDDDETKGYIQSLEKRYDESMDPESGAELITELEEFLREQN